MQWFSSLPSVFEVYCLYPASILYTHNMCTDSKRPCIHAWQRLNDAPFCYQDTVYLISIFVIITPYMQYNSAFSVLLAEVLHESGWLVSMLFNAYFVYHYFDLLLWHSHANCFISLFLWREWVSRLKFVRTGFGGRDSGGSNPLFH